MSAADVTDLTDRRKEERKFGKESRGCSGFNTIEGISKKREIEILPSPTLLGRSFSPPEESVKGFNCFGSY